jgi:hypothetical protein
MFLRVFSRSARLAMVVDFMARDGHNHMKERMNSTLGVRGLNLQGSKLLSVWEDINYFQRTRVACTRSGLLDI